MKRELGKKLDLNRPGEFELDAVPHGVKAIIDDKIEIISNMDEIVDA